jgi:hypothetical protein
MGIREYMERRKRERAEFNRIKGESRTEALKQRHVAYKAERVRAAREAGRRAAVPLRERLVSASKPLARAAYREVRGSPRRPSAPRGSYRRPPQIVYVGGGYARAPVRRRVRRQPRQDNGAPFAGFSGFGSGMGSGRRKRRSGGTGCFGV